MMSVDTNESYEPELPRTKAQAVVSALVGDLTLVSHKFPWPWPISVTLTPEKQEGILSVARQRASGSDLRIVAVLRRRHCQGSRLIEVARYSHPVHEAFASVVDEYVWVCSKCGYANAPRNFSGRVYM